MTWRKEKVSKPDDPAVDTEPPQQRRNGVQSIDRAVAILRCFDGRRPELGISELARSTGLSTTTVHRLLSAMQKNHLVRQTGTKRYGLGPFLLQLANSGAIPRTFREAALPFMTALRDEFDETIGLHEFLGSRPAHRRCAGRKPSGASPYVHRYRRADQAGARRPRQSDLERVTRRGTPALPCRADR